MQTLGRSVQVAEDGSSYSDREFVLICLAMHSSRIDHSLDDRHDISCRRVNVGLARKIGAQQHGRKNGPEPFADLPRIGVEG
jgi:hypothetical protein